MPPKKSPIWRHFLEDGNDPTTVICQVPGCKKPKVSRGKPTTGKGNLSNTSMVNHLKNNHPSVFANFTKAKTEVESAEKKKIEDEKADDEMEDGCVQLFNLRTQNQRSQFLHQASLNSYVSSSRTSLSSQGQGKGTTYDIHDIRAKDRHRGVLMMVIMDLQPWSFVNDPGFLYFSRQMDPHYRVASTTFYRDLLDKAYKGGVAKVIEKLKRDDPKAVACQLDGWSAYRHGYIGMLISYITSAWKRVSLCLACSPFDEHHTSENLGNWLEEKLASWKVLDKTNVVVSDSASNMLKMMEFLPNDMEHNSCLNHVLQLVINDEVFEKPEVKNIITNVKAFVNYCSNSVLLSSALRKKQEELGFSCIKSLVQDVKTRWNSTNDMTERFVELKQPIIAILDEDEWKNKIRLKSGSVVKFSPNDWRVMEKLVEVLKPFKDATVKLSAKSACISETIPTIASLQHTLKLSNNVMHDKGVRDLKSRLSENLAVRTGHLETSEVHSIATLLDWR